MPTTWSRTLKPAKYEMAQSVQGKYGALTVKKIMRILACGFFRLHTYVRAEIRAPLNISVLRNNAAMICRDFDKEISHRYQSHHDEQSPCELGLPTPIGILLQFSAVQQPEPNGRKYLLTSYRSSKRIVCPNPRNIT